MTAATHSQNLPLESVSAWSFLRQLEHSENPYKALPRYALEISETVETLFTDGQDVIQIGRIVAGLNGILIRHLIRLAENELGPPPTPFAWIVFGSEGRMEQLLLTDQDNALVYKEHSPEAQAYFKSLSQRVVNGLIQAGIPTCPGGYMATNWRQSLDDWLRLFTRLIRAPDPRSLLQVCIFFDFRVVYGDLSLRPLEQVLYQTEKQGIFLAHLSKTALEFRPPINFFHRLQSVDGQVDLKKGGIASIVHMARFYALQAGMRNRSTIERLEAAAKAHKLSREGTETLSAAYRTLLQLRLKEQIAEAKAGDTPDNKIRLNSLSPQDRRRLKQAFIGIRDLQSSIEQHY